MAITISTGVSLSLAKTYAAAKNVTAASNATNCVLTLDNSTAAITAGDYVEISTSTWGLLEQRVVRVSAANTTTITLEGVNTTTQSMYPAGGGVGTVRKISAWVALSQVKGLSASGGELQFADITAVDDVVARKVPTIRDAVTMSIDVYDDPSLGWYADVTAASEARAPFALLMSFPNGSRLAGNAYWSLQRIPVINNNEALVSNVGLSFSAEPIRYATKGSGV